jgi:hypothetical protein
MLKGVRESRLSFRPATYDDCLDLAPRLRSVDQEEVWVANEWLPEEALVESWGNTKFPWAGIVDGQVQFIFGIGKTQRPTEGIPWLLGSDVIKEISTEFAVKSRPVWDEVSEGYTYFHNCVWSKNTVHIRWLKHLGFEFARDPHPLGTNRELFYYFTKYQGI